MGASAPFPWHYRGAQEIPRVGGRWPDLPVFRLCAASASSAAPCCSEAGRAVPALPVRLGAPSPRARDLVSVVPRFRRSSPPLGVSPSLHSPFPAYRGDPGSRLGAAAAGSSCVLEPQLAPVKQGAARAPPALVLRSSSADCSGCVPGLGGGSREGGDSGGSLQESALEGTVRWL